MLTDPTSRFEPSSINGARAQHNATPEQRSSPESLAGANTQPDSPEQFPPGTDGQETCCVHLARQPSAARYARDAIQRELRSLGVDEASDDAIRECADAVLLIVSELVTNACRHSPGPADLRTSFHDHVMTVEVDDYGKDLPVIVEDTERGADGGFGMSLVDALSDDWGCERRDGGKTVYAHVSFP
ncbi:ATP-binding protein [Streptomyces sp. NPDC005529]|uniref:ATP-binding protein n=1 Tax=unclassified Streptomyces TaxID=2593676 RepID=UPI0033BC175F